MATLTHEEWLRRVPELVERARDEWQLVLGEPYALGAAGYAVRVELPNRARAVLKLVYPHRESQHEADALELIDGDGAVRLLARDESGFTMLIERCEPGEPLSQRGRDAALDVLIALLPRLWKRADEPFQTLADEARWWARYLPEKWTGDQRLLGAALDAISALAPTQGEQVLLQQDLHGDNVLSAQREPWLTIDPKPLVGEREFAVAPIVRSRELGTTRGDVLHRFDALTAELGLDRERARGWTIAQTVAWSNSSWHDDVATWLLR